MIEIVKVSNYREKKAFLSFPYQLYKHDPLWVPPIYTERERNTDPARGKFFTYGEADFFLAYRYGKLAGTICPHFEHTGGKDEALIGFFECVEDREVAFALFDAARDWARERGLTKMIGTYNMDREDSRGVLIEGRDRPPVVLCGHNPPYYQLFFEEYGFIKHGMDGLAYARDLEDSSSEMRRLYRLAEKVAHRKNFSIRHADLSDIEREVDVILELQNRALQHLGGHPYSRETIEAMVLPFVQIADPDLVIFVEHEGKTIGWFPGVPNINELLIHLNGLRSPLDYLKAWYYQRRQPTCVAVKSVALLPEYWDTGAAILMFAEMARQAIAKGYKWVDLSVTGEDNPDTWDLAHNMAAKIYKRYRFYEIAVD